MNRSRQAGFSMLETLVSMLVLSLGVIGVGAMQLAALRTTQQSGYQSIAVELASEIATAMRAHLYAEQPAQSSPYLTIDYDARYGEPSMPAKLCYGLAATCTPNELAKSDIYELEKRMKLAVPTARIRVCRDASPWDASTKSYKWDCAQSGDSSMPLVVKLGWIPRNPEDRDERSSDPISRPKVVLMVMPTAS